MALHIQQRQIVTSDAGGKQSKSKEMKQAKGSQFGGSASQFSSNRKNRFSKGLPEGLWGYIFIAPWLIGLLVLTLGPMLQSLYLSLTNYHLLEQPKWAGLANYKEILIDDKTFVQSLEVTFKYVLFSVPLKLIFALLVAMLLYRSIRGMSFFRSVYYLPSLIGGSVAIAAIWRNIFGMDGAVNKLLAWFGVPPMDWINLPDTSLTTLIILSVWQFGSAMVIFLAGLKQIPNDLYEAAAVDGATKIRIFFKITIPMLTPIILFNLVMQTINSFQMFTQAFVVTKGGPIDSTLVYALYLYQKAFVFFDMGYASALAWILMLIIAVATALIFITSRKWVHYEN